MAHQSLGDESGQMILCLVFLLAASIAPAASVANYTATTANVSGAPDAIRINILRWSTDAERDKLIDAWMLKTHSPARGGRGGPGRGRAGRGGGEATPVPQPAPEAMLAKALQESTTVGYLWSREVAGYAIRYAGRVADADGSERIVLITQRRLGAVNDLWKPVGTESPAYDFSVIELHLKPNGEGEGKTSLNGKVAAAALNMITLENFDALPVVLSRVQKQKSE
jgi:hypothetical protein